MQRLFRIIVNSAILAFINIGSIIAGFILYGILGGRNQMIVQVPSAVGFTLVGFALWAFLCRSSALQGFSLKLVNDAALVYVMAILCAAAIFVPIHYITQGYITSGRNITALCLFQLIVNAFAVPMAAFIARRDIEAQAARQ